METGCGVTPGGSSVDRGMLQPASSPRLARHWRWALMIALVVSSLYVFAMWLIDTRPLMNLNSYERAKFVDMVYGKAHRPFVYRTLVPTVVRWVRAAIPDPLNYGTHGKVYARWPALYGGMLYLGWELEYLTEYATAAVLMYAALFGFGLALKGLVRVLYEVPEWFAGVVPVVAMWLLPPFFVNGTHYVYDFMQLLLFTLLLVSLARQHWGAFYALLVLGLLNKETTVFISLIAWVYLRDRMPTRILMRHLVVQLGLFGVTKLGLYLRFASNPGTIVEDHTLINLYNALLRPYDLGAVLVVAVLGVLVAKGFADKPLILRRALWIAIPMTVLYATLGTYGEIRVFYELVPIVLLLCLEPIARALGIPMSARPPQTVKKED